MTGDMNSDASDAYLKPTRKGTAGSMVFKVSRAYRVKQTPPVL